MMAGARARGYSGRRWLPIAGDDGVSLALEEIRIEGERAEEITWASHSQTLSFLSNRRGTCRYEEAGDGKRAIPWGFKVFSNCNGTWQSHD
jgi:hypothetical protein